jgi:hypothetical protein
MQNITLNCNQKVNCYNCKNQCEGFKEYLKQFEPEENKTEGNNENTGEG